MTTHKTLRGPRGGMILCRDEQHAKAIDRSLFPGAQGGPLLHQMAAKAVAFHEALAPSFKSYQQQVRDNAARLAAALREQGLAIVTGGTDCHLVLADLRAAGVSGAEVEARARAANLVINKNAVPGDPRPPKETSGMRVGTPAVTTRGMGLAEMDSIAQMLGRLVRGDSPDKMRPRVAELCAAFPLP